MLSREVSGFGVTLDPKPDDPASIRPIFSGRYHEHQYEIDQRGLDAGPSWLGFWGLGVEVSGSRTCAGIFALRVGR